MGNPPNVRLILLFATYLPTTAPPKFFDTMTMTTKCSQIATLAVVLCFLASPSAASGMDGELPAEVFKKLEPTICRVRSDTLHCQLCSVPFVISERYFRRAVTSYADQFSCK